MEGVSHASTSALSRSGRPFWKRVVLPRVMALGDGELVLVDDSGETRIGRAARDGLRVRLTIHRDRLWRRVAFGGLLAATDAYLDGDWDADDLTALARLFSRNLAQATSLDSGLGRLFHPAETVRHMLSRNSRL